MRFRDCKNNTYLCNNAPFFLMRAYVCKFICMYMYVHIKISNFKSLQRKAVFSKTLYLVSTIFKQP